MILAKAVRVEVCLIRSSLLEMRKLSLAEQLSFSRLPQERTAIILGLSYDSEASNSCVHVLRCMVTSGVILVS